MNTQTISRVAVIILSVSPCCRPRPEGKPGQSVEIGSQDEKNTRRSATGFAADSGANARLGHSDTSPDQGHSYGDLEKELMEIQRRAGWPRNEEQELSYRESLRKALDHRKKLLFSISISPQAEKDRNDAWDVLEFRKSLSIFTDEQNVYAKKLLNAYSSAPTIEKLVIWELVRSRMKYSILPGGGRGLSGSDEILLRIEMAKLLFSALGIDKKELFDAVGLKTRAASSEAETKASRAEEEIEKLHIEQSKVAEKILEQHWKLTP
jgi:hypothetical protein